MENEMLSEKKMDEKRQRIAEKVKKDYGVTSEGAADLAEGLVLMAFRKQPERHKKSLCHEKLPPYEEQLSEVLPPYQEQGPEAPSPIEGPLPEGQPFYEKWKIYVLDDIIPRIKQIALRGRNAIF
jgi:hypothetical protein